MRILVRSGECGTPSPARIVETSRGKEIRGTHLMGIIDESGQVVIKLRDEYLIVEDDAPSLGRQVTHISLCAAPTSRSCVASRCSEDP